ncbi:unnamed protein product [Rhodiola kirilowii]
MVSTRKTYRSVIKMSSGPKKTDKKPSDALAPKPQIPKSMKSKIPIKQKLSPLIVKSTALPCVIFPEEEAVSSNPRVGVVDRKSPEPAAMQKEVPSQSAEKIPNQSGACSTPTSLTPPHVMYQSEVIPNPKAPFILSIKVNEAVVERELFGKEVNVEGDKGDETSRVGMNEVAVGIVKEGEPSVPVSKATGGSGVWREKIHASGYVHPGSFWRKKGTRQVVSPSQCLAKICSIRERLGSMSDAESDRLLGSSSQKTGFIAEKSELVKQDDELDATFKDIDDGAQAVQKEKAS